MTSLEALVICRDLGFLTLLSFDKKEIVIPSTQDYSTVRCNNPADKLEDCEFYSSRHCSNSPNVECLSRENYFYAIAPLRIDQTWLIIKSVLFALHFHKNGCFEQIKVGKWLFQRGPARNLLQGYLGNYLWWRFQSSSCNGCMSATRFSSWRSNFSWVRLLGPSISTDTYPHSRYYLYRPRRKFIRLLNQLEIRRL